MLSFKSGRAERIVHAIEYTSAPLLQANTEIARLDPWLFWSSKPRINSSSGRFRRKKVPTLCLRAARRRTKEWKCIPYTRTGRRRRKEGGRFLQIHLFRNQ